MSDALIAKLRAFPGLPKPLEPGQVVSFKVGFGDPRDPDKLAAADEISSLREERDRLRAALAELVACKDLKEQVAQLNAERPFPMHAFQLAEAAYNRRRPLAWGAARAALGERSGERE